MNETMTTEECVKECAHNCTKGQNLTVAEVIDCINDCKCGNLTSANTTQLVQRNLLVHCIEAAVAQGRTIGKLRWGTFFVISFILAVIVTGVISVYKKYSVIKEYRRGRSFNNAREVIYQRLA